MVHKNSNSNRNKSALTPHSRNVCLRRTYASLLTSKQGCSLGLERLGLETVSRRFLKRLGLVSVSRVWKNRTSRSRFGLEGSTSRSRLGLEHITSRSWSWVSWLVNIHAMHQACGYIRKTIMDLTRKKQVVKWQMSPVSVLNCDTAVSRRFLERLGLVSVLWLNVLWTSLLASYSVSVSEFTLHG